MSPEKKRALNKLWTILERKELDPETVRRLNQDATVEEIEKIYQIIKKQVDNAIEKTIEEAGKRLESEQK